MPGRMTSAASPGKGEALVPGPVPSHLDELGGPMRSPHPPLAQTASMMRLNRSPGSGRPTSYQIVVRGELSQRFSTVFEGMTLLAGDGQTVIVGAVADQAHLHGLLDRVGELGL